MTYQEPPIRELASGDGTGAPLMPWDRKTRYEHWQEEQGLPVHRNFLIEDVAALDTKHWEALNADAAFVELVGAAETNGAYVLKIAGGTTTNDERQVIEQVYYVLSGEGVTEIEGADDASIAWRPAPSTPSPSTPGPAMWPRLTR